MTQVDPEESLNNEIETEVAEEDIETLKQCLAEEKEKAEGYLANWQRSEADLINYKRRSDQEKEEIGKYSNASLILNLLPVLDDLERAFTSIPPNLVQLTWVDGIRLIERKLQASLEMQGVSPIKALGEPFDPNFHEAVTYEDSDEHEEGQIIAEVRKGYQIGSRVLRPALVRVAK